MNGGRMEIPEERAPGRGARLGFGLALAVLGGLPGLARAGEDRLHEVTWAHQQPAQVERFVVYVSSERGDTAGARQIEVGKPAGASSGSFQFYSAIVPVGSDEFLAVGAFGYNGVLGGLSEWSAVPPTRPGQPLVVDR
jgi:hypothetical protein